MPDVFSLSWVYPGIGSSFKYLNKVNGTKVGSYRLIASCNLSPLQSPHNSVAKKCVLFIDDQILEVKGNVIVYCCYDSGQPRVNL